MKFIKVTYSSDRCETNLSHEIIESDLSLVELVKKSFRDDDYEEDEIEDLMGDDQYEYRKTDDDCGDGYTFDFEESVVNFNIL